MNVSVNHPAARIELKLSIKNNTWSYGAKTNVD